MTVEEVRTRNADPVLNYIFFDSGSAKFPSRYVTYASPDEAKRRFEGSSERHDIKLMNLYRETLNILGDRLRKNLGISIVLHGCTDNTDDRSFGNGSDKSLLALARSRAETMRDYLINVWQIDPKRIKVEASMVPEKPSPFSTPEGRAENRRVEFRAEPSRNPQNDELLSQPIVVTNIEHLATPDRIDLIPTVSAPIVRSYASISAGGVELQTFAGSGSSAKEEKVWAPTEETLNKLRDSLNIDYDVWDSAGNHAHARSSIPLNIIHVTSDRPERVERFSLILFGFDESRLDRRNDYAIRNAAEMIPEIPVKRILIQGYTDETGDPIHNDELSQERAAEVQKRLLELLAKSETPLPKEVHSEGRGSHDLLYDNRLPEGRFFSRTVNITIERGP